MANLLSRRSFAKAVAGAAVLGTPALAQAPRLPASLASGDKPASAAIQALVDFLDERGGGTLEFPSGQFLIDQPINLANRRGIRFIGASGAAGAGSGTRLVAADSGIDIFQMDLTKGMLFQNLGLTRDASLRETTGSGFYGVNQTSDCRFIDCNIQNFEYGAYLADSWQNYFRGCLLGYCQVGAKVDIVAGQSNDTKFQQCLIGQCEQYELEINANTVYVTECEFESVSSTWGIFGKFGRGCVIANCSVIRGIYMGLEGARIIGNDLVDAPDQAGILLVRGHNAVIANNVIRNSANNGVRFFDTNDALLEGNQVLNSGTGGSAFATGVQLRGTSSRNNVRDNVVRSTVARHGVELIESATGNVIANNDLRGSSTSQAIQDNGIGTLLDGNLT